MTDDDALKQALAELGDVVRCCCHEAFRDRGLQDPQCNCDSMDAVRVVIARIEWLERERVLDAKLLADTQALLDTALEAVIDAKLVAEAKLAEVEAERDATTRLLAAAGDGLRLMARAEAAEATVATLTAQVEAMRLSAMKAMTIANGALDSTATEKTFRRDLVQIREELRGALWPAALTTETAND